MTLTGHVEEDDKKIEKLEVEFRKELREHQKKLLKMRRDFLATRRSLEYATTRRRARLSPIRTLPVEVILLILNLHFNSAPAIFFGNEKELRFNSRLAPLFVCRTWRNVALSTPTCWVFLKIVFDIESTGSLSGFDWKVDEINSRISSLMQHQILSARDSPFDVEVISTCKSHGIFSHLQDAPEIRRRFIDYWCYMRAYTENEFVLRGNWKFDWPASHTLTHLTLFGGVPHIYLSRLQTLQIVHYCMHSCDLSILRSTCPALRCLYIEDFIGTWIGLTEHLRRLPALQTLALRTMDLPHYLAGTTWTHVGDACRELGIDNVILPAYKRQCPPIGEVFDLLPNLASLGIVVKSKQAKLGLQDLQTNPKIAKVTNQIRTLGLHGSLLIWEQFSELALFVTVTRLELYPLTGMDQFKTIVPWDLIFMVLSGGTRSPAGLSYLPQFKELYFRDMSLDRKSSKTFFDSILLEDVEFSSSGDPFPLSVLRLTFSHCKLVSNWGSSSNSKSINLPDAEKLSLRRAKEFIDKHVGYLKMKKRKVMQECLVGAIHDI